MSRNQKEYPENYHSRYITLLYTGLTLRLMYGLLIAYLYKAPTYAYGILLTLLVGYITLKPFKNFKIIGVLSHYFYVFGYTFCLMPFFFIQVLPEYISGGAEVWTFCFIPIIAFEFYLGLKGYKSVDYYINNAKK